MTGGGWRQRLFRGRRTGARRWPRWLPVAAGLLLHVFYLIGDRTWWGEWISIWPPVGWLVLLLPLTIRARSGAGAVLLLSLVALHSDWPRPVRHARSSRKWIEPLLLLVELPGGRKLIVANVRLLLPSSVTWAAGGFEGSPADGFEARVKQYELLAALLREAMAATGVRSAIVAGDFNAPARMPSLEPMRAFLLDAWKIAGGGWGGTATADLPLARIDHCWVTPDLQVADAQVRKMPISDHRLLIVELTL